MSGEDGARGEAGVGGEDGARGEAGVSGEDGARGEAGVSGDEARREELHRQAVMAAGTPLLLLCAPLFAAFEGQSSMYEATRRDPVALSLAVLFFFWTPLLGAVGLGRGLWRRAPGKVSFWLPAVPQALAAGGLSLLLTYFLIVERPSKEAPLLWPCVAAGLGAVYVLARGIRRGAWERWGRLLAAAWLFHVQCALVLLTVEPSFLDRPPLGAWLSLFALSTVAPIFAWFLWPRRR